MFKDLMQKWEVAFLAKGGRLSNHERLIVKDFAQWLEFEAAQQSVQSDLAVRCAKCGGAIGTSVDYKLV